MTQNRRVCRRYLNSRKGIAFAAMTLGAVFQVSACQQEFALFGLRWAFSSITLPINTFIRDLLVSFA